MQEERHEARVRLTEDIRHPTFNRRRIDAELRGQVGLRIEVDAENSVAEDGQRTA